MPPRHRLRPYFRPLRRGIDSVQLGLSAEEGGIIVAGLEPADVDLLERLVSPLTEQELYALAADRGIAPARARQLFLLLHQQGVLTTEPADRASGDPRLSDGSLADDAEVLALGTRDSDAAVDQILDRAHRHVVVSGTGQLPWSVGSVLRASGVGRVDVGTWAEGSGPDLVVLVAEGVVDPRLGQPWRLRGIPLLPVVSDGRRVVVGPVVGHDPALPCLRCVELARAERDPARHVVVAQAVAYPGEVGGETTVVQVACGVVAMVVLATLAGQPVPPGVSVEVSLPWPRLDHRQWLRHPTCPDHAVRPEHSTRPLLQGARRTVTPRVTMTG